MRNPNAKCSICGKLIYRRPSDLKRWNKFWCSELCISLARSKSCILNCAFCNKRFNGHRNRRYCSVSCGNKARRGIYYSKGLGYVNKSQKRLLLLKLYFDFKTCMIEGCKYCKTFAVHRLIEGKNGGKYEIGNMFAICPNHHAEIHAGLIQVAKVNDCKLKIVSEQLSDVLTELVSKTSEV